MREIPQPEGSHGFERKCALVRRRVAESILALLIVAMVSLSTCLTASAAVQHKLAHHATSRHPRAHSRPRIQIRPQTRPRQPKHRPTVSRPAPVAASRRGEVALRFALAQLGKPYVYGGNGPYAFDCSGLVQQAWRAAGIQLPRTTTQQATAGTAVPLSQIQPGDLVIFYADASHVGIYAGNGEVITAPHSGASVHFAQVSWMPVYAVRRPR